MLVNFTKNSTLQLKRVLVSDDESYECWAVFTVRVDYFFQLIDLIREIFYVKLFK